MESSDTFNSPEEFAARIRELRVARKASREAMRDRGGRKRLSKKAKTELLEKTGSRCHICGGEIEDDNWHADHVLPHAKGGLDDSINFLPAHAICNSYRKAYEPEEFQWILKLGVWLKTQIEKGTSIGDQASAQFFKYEKRRSARSRK